MKVHQFILSSIFLLKCVCYCQPHISFDQQFYAKTTALNCNGNPKMVKNVKCKLRAVNWEHTTAEMDTELVGIVRNATLHFEVLKYTNQFRPFLINVTANLCGLLKKRKGNQYLNVILSVLDKYTNINHACPYSGHISAYGVYFDLKFIRFFIPSATYKLIFTFYEGWPYERLGTIALTIVVTEKSSMKRIRSKAGSN